MASHAESAHDLLDLDISTLRQYVELFPTEGLSKVIMGYLSSGISKYPLTVEDKEAPDLSEGGVALNMDVPVSQEDCLVLMTVSILCVLQAADFHSDTSMDVWERHVTRRASVLLYLQFNRTAFWKPESHHLPIVSSATTTFL
jgi:hypothetical protein